MSVKPVHYDKDSIKELTKELLVAGTKGAVQGAIISITTGLLLKRFSPTYRNVRNQVKVFYHSAWIASGSTFQCDKQLIKFQERYYQSELDRRSRILDEAAERGIFLEEDMVSKSVIPK
ncbi:hypothetical protein ACO0RG_001530 [Hanseniaspora osmophila]|uniref:Uncharacterized protein n=1 Tax=Hanseniaspora osmophila TaxID=56408 RepID=A0A1E5R0I7_9ASCO|nr:Uncharacterized protein AWRI3579_g4542 [Hanseniaspora osmophila]